MARPDAADMLAQAEALSLRVVNEAGLTVRHGEQPTEAQVGIAALHARQDAAMCVALLTMLIQRQAQVGSYATRAARAAWWSGLVLAVPTFGVAALLLWPLAYVLGGTFWRPPR